MQLKMNYFLKNQTIPKAIWYEFHRQRIERIKEKKNLIIKLFRVKCRHENWSE